MTETVEIAGYMFVEINIPSGTKMFGKSVRRTFASFTKVDFGRFITHDAINDLNAWAEKFVSDRMITLGTKNVGCRVEMAHVCQRVRPHENFPANQTVMFVLSSDHWRAFF